MNDDALIHLRVPKALKGRWVRASRAAGERLTDWIIEAVERDMQKQATTIAIPDNMKFADLRLTLESDGSVSFDWDVIERICQASGISPEVFSQAPEDNVSGLIVRWYNAHRADGGAPDPAAEHLIEEVKIENERGSASHRPGRA